MSGPTGPAGPAGPTYRHRLRYRRLLLATATTAAALALATPALAWKTLSPARLWELTDMPVEYFAPDPDQADVLSMPTGVALEELHHSFAHWWLDVPCSPLDAEFGGYVSNSGDPEGDGSIRIYWEDPDNRLGTGILAACWTYSNSDQTVHSNGMDFYRITDFDIVFNDGVNFGTHDDLYGGGCTAQTSFESVATHEIGHGFGLGHSCESYEACPDPILRGATMYWAIGSCETGREIPNEDDVTGINALYGIYTDFEATTVASGKLPLEVSFGVLDELDEGVETYLWTFGDGSEPSADATPTHVYEAEGQYTVTLTVTGTDDECGEFEDTVRKVGYVLACGMPEPAFSWRNLGGGQVQFENTTPTQTFGCVYGYEWDMGEGDPVASFEPFHDYGHEGSWNVTLTASGPGGANAVDHTIDVKLATDPRDDEPVLCRAEMTPSPRRSLASGLTLLALALAALIRRR